MAVDDNCLHVAESIEEYNWECVVDDGAGCMVWCSNHNCYNHYCNHCYCCSGNDCGDGDDWIFGGRSCNGIVASDDVGGGEYCDDYADGENNGAVDDDGDDGCCCCSSGVVAADGSLHFHSEVTVSCALAEELHHPTMTTNCHSTLHARLPLAATAVVAFATDDHST